MTFTEQAAAFCAAMDSVIYGDGDTSTEEFAQLMMEDKLDFARLQELLYVAFVRHARSEPADLILCRSIGRLWSHFANPKWLSPDINETARAMLEKLTALTKQHGVADVINGWIELGGKVPRELPTDGQV